MSQPATGLSVAARRAARLEARLTVYAQYAALTAEELAAAARGDAERAEALAREREGLAEQFVELRDATAADATSAAPSAAASFDAVLAEVLGELEGQAAVDLEFRRRLEALRGVVPTDGAAPAVRALLPGAVDAGAGDGAGADVEAEREGAADAALAASPLAGALLTARASGVGGALAGQYPGIAARGESAAYAADEGARSKVDLKF